MVKGPEGLTASASPLPNDCRAKRGSRRLLRSACGEVEKHPRLRLRSLKSRSCEKSPAQIAHWRRKRLAFCPGAIAERTAQSKRAHPRQSLQKHGSHRCSRQSTRRHALFRNPGNLSFVRHKDFDRSNYAASNLEWCDRESLVKRTLKSGRLTPLVSPKRAKRLNIVALIYELRLAGMRLSEIAMALDIGADAATNVCNGKAWQDASRPSLARTQTRAQKKVHERPPA